MELFIKRYKCTNPYYGKDIVWAVIIEDQGKHYSMSCNDTYKKAQYYFGEVKDFMINCNNIFEVFTKYRIDDPSPWCKELNGRHWVYL